MSDGGPDFNPTSVVNSLYLYRLFKLLNLDILAAFTYAARYSAFNCIEHLWSPLSDKLSSVVFSNVATGDTKPPVVLGKITTEALQKKEKEIFDRAMNSIASGHWRDTVFNGHPVTTTVIKCNEDDLLFKDYEQVKAFLKSPLRELHNFATLQKEFVEMLRYIDRHHNEVIFQRCNDRMQ